MTSEIQAARLISQAQGLLITAGAGMGVDSGLPDFRGSDGFWGAYPALKGANIDFRSIASPKMFAKNPKLAWGFYGHRLALYRQTIPHEGFKILKQICDALPRGGFVLTSNVDGQFQTAGFQESLVWEIHGSIHRLQCIHPCEDTVWSASDIDPDIDDAVCEWRGALPTCPACQGLARPNILMFDDRDWLDSYRAHRIDTYNAWRERAKPYVIIELGAGTAIPSLRMLGKTLGYPLVRINPHEYLVMDEEGVGLADGALNGLRRIQRALESLGWKFQP